MRGRWAGRVRGDEARDAYLSRRDEAVELSLSELDEVGVRSGLATLLLGVGNALSQLPFIWHRTGLSYLGLCVALRGLFIAALCVVDDFKQCNVAEVVAITETRSQRGVVVQNVLDI